LYFEWVDVEGGWDMIYVFEGDCNVQFMGLCRFLAK